MQYNIWSFHVVVLQRKNYNTRAQPLYCSLCSVTFSLPLRRGFVNFLVTTAIPRTAPSKKGSSILPSNFTTVYRSRSVFCAHWSENLVKLSARLHGKFSANFRDKSLKIKFSITCKRIQLGRSLSPAD